LVRGLSILDSNVFFMVKAVYILKARRGSSRSLNDLLRLISNRTRYLAGCSESEMWYNKETSYIMLNELWRSMKDLENYIVSQQYKQMLAALELSSVKPLISFYDCEKIRGFDLIEEVLMNQDHTVV
jgi:quinol monooxygenase YgiN